MLQYEYKNMGGRENIINLGGAYYQMATKETIF